MVKFTEIPFVHVYLWPALMGLLAAVVTALASGAPQVLVDGLQPQDFGALGGIALSAAIGFGATIMQRYAGKRESWRQPKKLAIQAAGIGGVPLAPLEEYRPRKP